MKKIYSAADLPEAHLISHLLARAGIAHHIFNENLQGGVGELPFTHIWPDIWVVDDADAEQAGALIREYEHSASQGGGEPRCCPACGEENPPTFEICWRCGTSLTVAGN